MTINGLLNRKWTLSNRTRGRYVEMQQIWEIVEIPYVTA